MRFKFFVLRIYIYIRFIPKHRHIFAEERKKNGKACSAVKYWESEMHTVI